MTTFEKFIDEEHIPHEKEKKIGCYLIGISSFTQEKPLERVLLAKSSSLPIYLPVKKLQLKFSRRIESLMWQTLKGFQEKSIFSS